MNVKLVKTIRIKHLQLRSIPKENKLQHRDNNKNT